MVNRNIKDDLFIHGKPDSSYSKINKPLEKKLQLEGSVDITSIESTAGDLTLKGKVDIDDDGAEVGQLNVDGTDSDGSAIRVNGVDIADYVHSFNVRKITSSPSTLTTSDKIVDVEVQGASPAQRAWTLNFPEAATSHPKWYKIHFHGDIGKKINNGLVLCKPALSTEWMDGQRESDGNRKGVPIMTEGTYVFRTILDYKGSGAAGWVVDSSHHKTFKEQPFFTAHAASTANLADLTSDLDAGGTIDGVTLVEGMEILLKDQSTTSENGVYVVPEAGLGVVPIRSHYMDTSENAGSSHFHVNQGTVNGGRSFKITNAYGSDVVGTDNLTVERAFVEANGNDTEIQFNDSGTLSGSSDLTWDGTVMSTNRLSIADRGTVTQTTNINTAVTLNAQVGSISIVPHNLAGHDVETFTLNNSFITANSMVLCTINSTLRFVANAGSISAGSCSIVIINPVSTTINTSGVKIDFLVI